MGKPDSEDKKFILVIDDDTAILDFARAILEKAGYHVETAETAAEGMVRARRKTPAAMIVDIHMPGINGIDFCRKIRGKPDPDAKIVFPQEPGPTANVPIIFMTSANGAETVKSAGAAGGNGYILKPVEPDKLIARVKKFVLP